MERRYYLWTTQLIWIGMLIQLGIFTSATNIPRVPSQISNDLSFGRYAWSSWGSWTPCSKTCGGGVAIQERQCLPRSHTSSTNSTSNSTLGITVRITRQTGDCVGVGRRYHQCNTHPCPGGERDMRAEQCAAYDRRPYRGRFYTWIPYIDGDAPCMLNCRPLGQQFYASLSLVADGTPCTKPGFKAICVHGSCKVVGRDTVLGVSGTREIRCGRHLVSGLFSRPRLPLGYSYVTTVPRGACRLNVTELVSSENYIALRISNGSYIMNGEFAVSTPGAYDAAGARFIYSRTAGVDSVFAKGPIHHHIDIMILYTQPNPSIKYEYFIEPIGKDFESVTKSGYEISTSPAKHIRRHHNFDYPRPGARYLDSEEYNDEGLLSENVVGTRKFVWKIITFTQCTRSCGGGIQLGKYRCVESNHGTDREVSPVHCSGSPPMGKRRRCGSTPCPPRWRAAAWSSCPKCGPASKTRIVGCVEDHSRGIIKISDQKCPLPKPQTTEPCEIPVCKDSYTELEVSHRIKRPRDEIESFRGGPVYTLTPVNNNSAEGIGPEYSLSAAVGWLATEWSDCVGWCIGEGVQTRNVRCADPSGCAPLQPPQTYRKCTPKLPCETHYGQWFTGEWSPCSSCQGKQIRGVLCIGGTGRHLRDSACKENRPVHERECDGDCSHEWYTSEWGQCSGNCSINTGIQRRTVWCAKQGGGASSEQECLQPAPLAEKSCQLRSCNENDIPPELSIESQIISGSEISTTSTTTYRTTTHEDNLIDCEDKLNNCVLAVQARLCHYNYYVQNCCYSCGR